VAAMARLGKLEGYVRRRVAGAMRLRLAPEIRFVRDDALADAVSSARHALVLRGSAALPHARQVALARTLERRLRGTPTFVLIDADADLALLVPEMVGVLGAGRLSIPSLETRREEIPSMVRAFFERHAMHGARLSTELYEALTRAAWPGEIAELVECVGRIAAAHPDEPRLGPEHLVKPLARRGGRLPGKVEAGGPVSDADRIRQALATHNGSVAGAARALHLSRQALYREAARLGIDIRKSRDGEG